MLARMRRVPRSRACLWSVALLALAGGLGACRAARTGTVTAPDPRPVRRASGPRLPPPFEGRDTTALGLVRAFDLLWLRSEDLPLWQEGGAGVRPVLGSPPGEGLTLRTDHVLVTTDLTAVNAIPLARAAQQHVEALIRIYGDALDLRLPHAPLPVTVFQRRSDFEVALAQSIPEPTGWNAFYDVRMGVVRVCAEPSRAAALPLLADLRHELTHAVLDLSASSPPPHPAIVGGLCFWLWEGIAVHAESVVGAPDDGAGAEALRVRAERFRASAAAHGRTPLERFFRLDQPRFEGRHYDQASQVMAFLAGEPDLWPRTLDLLRRLLRGDVLTNDPEREFAVPAETLEQRWRAWLTARGLG